jgi:uncharacterized protein YdhG (YjbR/CyaY superfamily)
MNKTPGVDGYIAGFDTKIQERLQSIRRTVREVAPEADEAMSYGMPTFRISGKNMIHFASFPTHIGVYATPDGHAEFEMELQKYKRGKGSVQFPLDEPLPLDLIKRIAIFRAKQIKEGIR